MSAQQQPSLGPIIKAKLGSMRGHVDYVVGWIMWAVGLLLAAAIIGTAARATGHPVPYLPIVDHVQLVAICGALYLWCKR